MLESVPIYDTLWKWSLTLRLPQYPFVCINGIIARISCLIHQFCSSSYLAILLFIYRTFINLFLFSNSFSFILLSSLLTPVILCHLSSHLLVYPFIYSFFIGTLHYVTYFFLLPLCYHFFFLLLYPPPPLSLSLSLSLSSLSYPLSLLLKLL